MTLLKFLFYLVFLVSVSLISFFPQPMILLIDL